MAEVKVADLRVTYNRGRTVAADDVSFEVADGEFCILLGPSGCGKTTVLHSIAGLIRPDRGEVRIGDQVVTSVEGGVYVRPQDRNVAMVFQEYALYPNLTVWGNLAFPLEARGMRKAEVKRKVSEVAELLGITELLKRRPAQLSGGQRQRVALGRALVRDPSVFLLDEPLGNLDAKLRVQVRFELKRIQKQLKATMIYVTHDQTEAMTMGDRIVLMKDGKLVQAGPPRELYEEPRNLFVAGFVGMPPINLLHCTVASSADGLLLDAGEVKLPAPETKREKLSPGMRLVVGIRPADIAWEGEGIPLEATLEGVEPMGDSVIVHGSLGSIGLTAKWALPEIQESDRIKFVLDPERLHLFDPESGDRI